jgi:flagellar biosynthesis protein FlhB
MSSSAGERTEKATSRRRQRAKDQGQFAYSQELTSAITLAVCATTIFYFLKTPEGFRTFLESVLSDITTADNPEQVLEPIIRQAGVYFLTLSAPVFIAAVVSALAGSVLQGLPMFPAEAATLKWDKLNPMQGLSKLKTQISWMQWLKLLALVGVVGWLVWGTFSSYWEQLVTLPAHSIDSSNAILRAMTVRIISYTIGAVVILSVGDFFYQRWRFEESIKQTKAEVKEDMKALEGNPQIKGKIRQIQREHARRRMMSRVKNADVIVTNPTHFAVALEYKPDSMTAPRVVAKGQDFMAQKIKELGREHDIPTVENVSLARALYRSVEVEQEIPMELYKAVAEVLAYVYKVRRRS